MVSRYEAKGNADISRLAEPLKFELSRKTAPNRFLNAAMGEDLSTWDPKILEARGIPTKELIEVYRRWGEGGWGIVETGNIMIDLQHTVTAGSAIIPPGAPFEGERFEAFKALAAAGKAEGSLIIGQVSHPGRQIPSKIVKESISASAVQLPPRFGKTYPPTRAATQSEISQIVQAFAHAAAYLDAAGFDGIQLHAAHGYLLAQFLSPTTNKRTDAYGGSVVNRARIITEIFAAIRERTSPGFILSAKLNSVEFQDEGLTTADAAELVKVLQDAGVDYLELSGGTAEVLGMNRRESTKQREAFFLEFADKIVPALGPADQRRTKVFIVGGLRTASAMVAALDVVDGVGIGRPASQEPSLAGDILAERVTGAIRPSPPFEDDFRLSLLGSASQIKAIGKGYEPFDLSDTKVTAQLEKDIQVWTEVLAEDGDKVTKSGWPDYTGELQLHLAN
ncbi:hypothetical protein VPNG_02520 [Cytospora leucostoma]|uniref:NADH:flavin oxidoreductase/NADH oxidase N-terminal domain-containing protein n=1 Tax=Cytospora leucostoma TaxID=1230097 RepID=A0A423XJ15_9PEZI|nr:hypothetical protein VPNG_02520 [Cytospora leucostoma]